MSTTPEDDDAAAPRPRRPPRAPAYWTTPLGGGDPAGWSRAALNPHCHQVLWNAGALGYAERRDIPFARTVDVGAAVVQRRAYRRRHGERKTTLHWGQRKLLMSEIEFLSLHGHRARTVLYAGAAPGTHVRCLAEMFPEHSWVLVDPAPFTVQQTDRIRVLQGFFTDDMARAYRGTPLLFVSDIRSADWTAVSDAEVEEAVRRDMAAQMRWCDLMCPQASMLKFRLPWEPGLTEYLAGEAYLPVWGPLTTTEARLVSTGLERRLWDNKQYEEQMFYFNTVMRPAMYPHGVRGEGIDHCYDCRAEVHILEQYLRLHGAPSELPIEQRVAELSKRISRELSSSRKLCSPNLDPAERKKGIVKRQYIDGKPAYDAHSN
eukprot:m51a1_g11601 hypothetical protein (375) ;mRNA; f:129125-131072